MHKLVNGLFCSENAIISPLRPNFSLNHLGAAIESLLSKVCNNTFDVFLAAIGVGGLDAKKNFVNIIVAEVIIFVMFCRHFQVFTLSSWPITLGLVIVV
jgi:hypothetical protein